MGIFPVGPSADGLAVTGVATELSISPSAGVSVAEPTTVAGADSWWVSPPGLYFSVLHEIAQRFPMELKLALARAMNASPTLDEETLSVLAGESLKGTSPPRARSVTTGVTPPPVPAEPPAAPAPQAPAEAPAATSTVQRLMAALSRLAQQNPSEFQAVAAQVATGLEQASGNAAGPAAMAMSSLAMQLSQSALPSAPTTTYRRARWQEPSLPGPVPAINRSSPTR